MLEIPIYKWMTGGCPKISLEVLDLIPPVCEAMVEQLTIDTAVSFVRVLRLLESAPVAPVAAPANRTYMVELEAKDGETASCEASTGDLEDLGISWNCEFSDVFFFCWHCPRIAAMAVDQTFGRLIGDKRF